MTDFIGIYDEALPKEFCERFLARFEQSRHQQPGRTGAGVEPDKKVSTDIALDSHPEFADDLKLIRETTARYVLEYFKQHHFGLIAPVALKVRDPRTQEVVNLTHDNFAELGQGNEDAYMRLLYRLGPIQAQKYLKNQGNYNYWHCEVYPQKDSVEALHRTLLFMYYLNDVDEGGTTDFYYQNKQIPPRQGRMVIAPAYFTHTHRGTTPLSDDKYILTSWVLMNPGNVLFG
ncbi:MAG: 2OG-Fe(II) oxygenase [Idiomarina sp.]|nr:2OG-Fe(II) oxygenase [Idiomarina sp.]